MSVGVIENRLAPEVRLVCGLLFESDTARLELVHESIQALALEMDRDRFARGLLWFTAALKRERAVSFWALESCVTVACDQLGEAQQLVKGDRSVQIRDPQGDVIQVHPIEFRTARAPFHDQPIGGRSRGPTRRAYCCVSIEPTVSGLLLDRRQSGTLLAWALPALSLGTRTDRAISWE
jgi:hypothetical protein